MRQCSAALLQIVMIDGADCSTVPMLLVIFLAVQPSHSDDFRNTQEPNGLDTDSYSLTVFDDDLMAIR